MQPSRSSRKGFLLPPSRLSSLSHSDDLRNHTRSAFDQATGQMYTETTTRVLSSRDRAWSRRTNILRKRGVSGTNSRGTCSLQNAALEQTLRSIEDITPDLFDQFPVVLICRIWDAVKRRCIVSFKTWALFARYLLSEPEMTNDFLCFNQQFPIPKQSLGAYIEPLMSNSLIFITSLSIVQPVPMADLLKLSQLENLGILEILNKDDTNWSNMASGVSDRLLRGWHHAATTENAFRKLRVLRLCDHHALTSRSLNYVDGFPALTLYNVRGCAFDSSAKALAKSLGWRSMRKNSSVTLFADLLYEHDIGLHTKYGQASSGAAAPSKRSATESSNGRRLNKFEVSSLGPPSTFVVKKAESVTTTPQHTDTPRQAISISTSLRSFLPYQIGVWEKDLYDLYVGIGDHIQESDPREAGMKDKSLVAQTRESPAPLPMVFVTIGTPTPFSKHLERDDLVFCRRLMPSEHKLAVKGDNLPNLQGTDLSQQPSSFTDTSSQSKKQKGVQKTKKRKLEDVLDAFS